ncbi:MAG: hypothetical protein B7Z40_21280 [Bosea sp. 12-68-7]|nr:MAG: hypothetical protein B7Z40_21280 [Bosea sp. 12-68-7]
MTLQAIAAAATALPLPSPFAGLSAMALHRSYFHLRALADHADMMPCSEGEPLYDHLERISQDVGALEFEARTRLATVTKPDDRALLRRVVLDFEMLADSPGDEFEAVTALVVARAAAQE